ncbi:MAG: PmoA family protein [Verrucomicrobia bacterium]|nr:PmoA family protein [Verrucomicrobiota bacterium]
MSFPLQLEHEGTGALCVRRTDGGLLWRYVFGPATPANESPRPYAHPVCSMAGDVLTNFRPNDHPWHHGLSLTIASVGGTNFWGGPSHREADGYKWRSDHGVQIHRAWTVCTADRLEHTLDWCHPRSGSELLHERRVLVTTAGAAEWSLRWTSELLNVSGRDLALDHYESLGRLAGSHYTGLQFRGARDLLDEHGDAQVGITAEGRRAGETAIHGENAEWMEWACQHDGTLRRTRIRFENLTGPIPWFVRMKSPLAAFSFHRGTRMLPAGSSLRLDHRLTFTNA